MKFPQLRIRRVGRREKEKEEGGGREGGAE
jgi:hypothetical protein